MRRRKTAPRRGGTLLITALALSSLLAGCASEGTVVTTATTGTSDAGAPPVDTGLGDISFTTDGPLGRSGDYAADGSDFALSVTDAQGYVWTLEIPGDALLSAETITMTPLAAIESTGFPAELSGGILLAPDGLRFVQNARITVTGPSGEIDGLLLSSGHDGSELGFMWMDRGAGVSAPLQHFSALFLEEPGKQEGQTNEAIVADLLAQHEAVLEEARNLLGQPPDTDVPTPPDISLECLTEHLENGPDGETSSVMRQIEDYIAQLGGREAELAGAILRIASAYYEHTGEDLFTGDTELFEELTARVMGRVDRLVADYSSQPEKLLAVLHAYVTYVNAAAFIGAHTGSLSPLTLAARTAFEHSLEQIQENHRFGYIGQVFEAVKLWHLVDPTGVVSPEVLAERLQKALRFSLHYELLYNTSDTSIQIAGDGEIAFTGFFGQEHMTQGSGTGSYVSTEVTFSTDPYRIETTFPIKLLMDLDACGTQKVTLWMDRLAAETETHIVTDDGVDVSSELPGIVSSVVSSIFPMETATFSDQEEALAYFFDPELRDGQVEIVTQTYEGNYSGAEATVLIQIEHTPGP